jgi:pantetheine-phosphate adenylyltransferase
MATRRIAIFPGSFDPLTNGHVDLVERASRVFDEVVVAVLVNAAKTPAFTVDERLEMIREAFTHLPSVSADAFDGLLVEFAVRRGAVAIVRGVRNVADFEYEQQMALLNRHLRHDVETLFFTPTEKYSYVSSRLIKEVVSLGGSVTGLVPAHVERRLTSIRTGHGSR